MTEYVYRVVDKDGGPLATGNTIRSVKTYQKLSTAQAIATRQTREDERFIDMGYGRPRAPYRVQRAAVVWEDA